jgi:hypothetical protein
VAPRTPKTPAEKVPQKVEGTTFRHTLIICTTRTNEAVPGPSECATEAARNAGLTPTGDPVLESSVPDDDHRNVRVTWAVPVADQVAGS